MAGAYKNGQAPKTTGLISFHMEGRGRCVQVFAEFQNIKHEDNGFFGGEKKSAGVQRCRAASAAVVKLICKE